VIGTDVSGAALRRAAGGTDGSLLAGVAVADMRRIPLADAGFDVVVCADNALPHLLTAADVVDALREMRRVAVPRGLVLVSTRDYDELRRTRPGATGVQVSREGGRLSATFQVWTWHDDGERYDYEHLMVSGAEAGWRVDRRTGTYWAISTAELSALAADAGLAGVRWLAPAESGFFQPLMVARA
jgi:SAM-dependent methyltransferase